MTRVRTLCTVLALTCTALFASTALAEQAAWDQAQVTAIAKDLAAAGEGWEQAMRRQPGLTEGSGEAEDVFGMLGESRVLREQSAALSAELAAGKGFDKTHDMYRTLKEMVDDTHVDTQRADLDAPSKEAWAKVTDAMGRIAPYYTK
jgi:hypothetical protein